MNSEEARPNSHKKFFAVGMGGLLGGLTFAVGPLSTISANPIIGAVQMVVMVLLFPGLIGAMGVSGNVHAFQLWVAAAINGLIYCGVGGILYAAFRRVRMRKRR